MERSQIIDSNSEGEGKYDPQTIENQKQKIQAKLHPHIAAAVSEQHIIESLEKIWNTLNNSPSQFALKKKKKVVSLSTYIPRKRIEEELRKIRARYSAHASDRTSLIKVLIKDMLSSYWTNKSIHKPFCTCCICSNSQKKKPEDDP